MRKTLTIVTLLGALTAAPALGFGSTPSAGLQSAAKPAKAAKAAPAAAVATRATSGVVKSVNDTTLVITRTGKKPDDVTFVLNAATHRSGTIDPGARVSVRYKEDGKTNVATAITAQAPKGASKKAPSSH